MKNTPPKKMTPKLLRTAGRLLYGERWKSELARALRVQYSSVVRWDRGLFSMAPDKAEILAELCWQRMLKLDMVRDQIRAALPTSPETGVGPRKDSPADPAPAHG